MATKSTKKSVSQKPVEEKVDVNSANDLAEENANLKSQLAEMMSNYKDMQLQLQNMLLAQQAQNTVARPEGMAKVGCRIFNGVTLSSQGGDINIPIQYREEVEIDYSELREIFKNIFGYKNLFKKGVLYFVNKDDYKKFNIKEEIDISDEGLIKVLTENNASSVIEIMKSITRENKDLTEMFTVIYQIAYLIDTKKVDLDYEIRSNLEKYFNVDFKTLINNLHDANRPF